MLRDDEIGRVQVLSEAGINHSEIARIMHIHRHTVRHVLERRERTPGHTTLSKETEMSKPSKLEPYKDYLHTRLADYPDIQGRVLLTEIQHRGYQGGYTILKDYLRLVRPKPVTTTVPFFETNPGEQMQVDFGSGITRLGGQLQRVWFVVFVLGYSRMLYVEFVKNQRLITLIQAHLQAFQFFGGYCRNGLYDNMKQLVKRLEQKKVFTALWNDFADFYGFNTITHRIRHPQTKGKVERMVPYVRHHLLYGQSYRNWGMLEDTRLHWIPEANQRVHSVLGEIPQDRLEREKPFLLPCIRSYPLCRLEQRTVRSRGDVVFANQHYLLDTVPKQGVVYGETAAGVLCSLMDGEGNPLNFDLSVNVERRRLQEYAFFLEGS